MMQVTERLLQMIINARVFGPYYETNNCARVLKKKERGNFFTERKLITPVEHFQFIVPLRFYA